ncbi:MAG: hypothetical protein JXB88_19225 [Spirochaetales bacterium]|nr:hypothetical protein [Spirochaetales bacterium]
MKKKIKKKYAPGELDKTRRNIGKISIEEAKRIAKKLGGEIGVEQDPEDVTNKYKEMQYKSYGRIITKKKRTTQKNRTTTPIDKKNGKQIVTKKEKIKKKDKKTNQGSFIDRVRLDFLCSKPEYQLKPLSGAIASLFSFILAIPDKVNPNFIMTSRTRFYTTLYNFVTAIRSFYLKSNKEIYAAISEHSFFSRILLTIKNWDLSGINLELNILRRQPNRLKVRKLGKLCKLVFYPFGILYDLEYDLHIKEAITWAYNINRSYLEKKGGMLLKTKELYEDALNQMDIVFNSIKKMFYPLLLKLVSNKYYLYDEFIKKERNTILAFLGISEKDVIQPEKIEKKITISDKTRKETAPDKEEETLSEKENRKPYLEGIKLLEYLYPGAGWSTLHQFPDLYPYFQPLFRFPPGFELIPKEDPLHQIMIFCTIIGYLFYGFRHIEFQSIRNERLELLSVKSKLDSFLSIWPAYINDIISKIYLSRLQDYCRNMEKDSSFHKTEVAAKVEMELDHVKKMFFLPYQPFQFKRKITLITKKNIPKLYFLTAEIDPILEKITEEINAKFKEKRSREMKGETVKLSQLYCESVKNPWSKIKFDVENPLSKRLNKLLYKQVKDSSGHIRVVDRRSNANLIIYTSTLLAMLDYLINIKSSHLYQTPQTCLFRSLKDDGVTPQYSVPLLDTENIINREVNREDGEKETLKKENGKQADSGTWFKKQKMLDEELVREIHSADQANSVFSIILFHLFSPSGAGQIQTPVFSALAGVIKNIIRHLLDTPFRLEDDDFLIILKDMDIHSAIGAARKITSLVKNTSEFNTGNYHLSAGVIQYQRNWKFDKFRKLITKVKLILHKQKLSRIVFVDRDTGNLKALK